MPLDIQARNVDRESVNRSPTRQSVPPATAPDDETLAALAAEIRRAQRPVVMLGGGVSRECARAVRDRLIDVPLMTTWNGADRIEADHPFYFGRPNTWGQRYANLLLQQADLVVALGTRLGLALTGFNWQEFVPVGKVAQVDLDRAELEKGHPRVDIPIVGDADRTLSYLVTADLGRHQDWVDYCRAVKAALPLNESVNKTRQGYISPYEFGLTLSRLSAPSDIIVPSSAGGSFTVLMQSYQQRRDQLMITEKGSGSMGYGLSGGIGAALAGKGRRTIVVEGDGGFVQNMQEIGTAAINNLNLKIFIFDDGGYASIRMTQQNYFGGHYVGCDAETGLGLPDWKLLFAAYGVPTIVLSPQFDEDPGFAAEFDREGVSAFIVPIDPEQTYFPKITSRVTANGGMVSNPLHLMSPALDEALARQVGRYLPPGNDRAPEA
jgi:acetolactate synthase-1/2/3 large subunit